MLTSLFDMLDGGLPDEIIWTADLEYWVAGQKAAGTLRPEFDGEEGRLRLCRDLGVMPYYWYEQFWLAEPVYDGVEVKTERKQNQIITVWDTPVGQLQEVTAFAETSCSYATLEHPIKDKKDLEVLLYVLKHRCLKPSNLDNYAQRRELYAQYDGIPAIAMPRSPLPALAVEWCGIERLTYLMMDCPDLINEILSLFENQEEPVIEAVCGVGSTLVHFSDNLTSDFYTPFFEGYMAKPYQKRLDLLHTADVKCAVHLDGTVKGMLPKLAEVGFDAIEALTPVPSGDVPIEEMRALANNDNVILWGGVPGNMFCEPYTWDDMERHIKKVLDSWSGERFVLGVADQVPANGDIEMCRKISELIKDAK
jgi:hypothetical protein